MVIKPGDLISEQIILVQSEAHLLKTVNTEVVQNITAEGYHVIMITINQPSIILSKMYARANIDTSLVFFIDAITNYALGKDEEDNENTLFINNPGDLTEIGIAITKAMTKFENENICIVLDSISTMLIYTSSARITKFIHYLTNKIRLSDINGVLFAAKNGLDPGFMIQLTTFVDEIKEE
ncbi:hypothetical protein L0665_00930 [Methanogenium marinum]|uniref:KaiC-like domain-containing protein n=1 Tax=Methanogenium marinum TaxID=348610 RepID=A0A9Q4KTZ2_9EURY|nr:hypothetical protein [Methanogenium marinum]MDE4907191.1 hypothetical protein [Methanogenium marinum]